MRVLVTGDRGYIGRVLVPFLLDRGYDVVGVDTDYYRGCNLYEDPPGEYERVTKDVRHVSQSDFDGIDAVHHLAALSNDPLGKIDPDLTTEINLDGTLRLAELAKEAGVERFVFSSSCSVYGASGGDVVDETAPVNPLTAYADSKVQAERALADMEDSSFTPVFLRNATAHGLSPRLRFDLVVNNLTGWAATTGQVVIKSDGTPWRPLVHIRDISRAFELATSADAELVSSEAFNVGSEEENYQIREVARIVGENVPGTEVTYGDDPSPDSRTYRVTFEKIEEHLGFSCSWDVPASVREIYERIEDVDLDEDQFKSDSFRRLDRIEAQREGGQLDERLFWTE